MASTVTRRSADGTPSGTWTRSRRRRTPAPVGSDSLNVPSTSVAPSGRSTRSCASAAAVRWSISIAISNVSPAATSVGPDTARMIGARAGRTLPSARSAGPAVLPAPGCISDAPAFPDGASSVGAPQAATSPTITNNSGYHGVCMAIMGLRTEGCYWNRGRRLRVV